MFSPLTYGARGDGRSKDTEAVQKAIDSCAAEGGGVVALDAGCTFLCGGLVLRTHVKLHLSAGALLRASPDRKDYHATGALLFAKDVEDVEISGTGVIDGNFRAFFAAKGPAGYAVPQPFLGPYDPLETTDQRNPADGRPRMILFLNCRRIRLENFTIKESPTWTIHPIGCDDIRISGLSILNDLEVPNCDGIDIDHCRNVRIEGCHIIAGDDCLVLKASRNFGHFGPCESITISNCTLESSSAAIKVEPEGPFPVRDAVISNCTIRRSNRGISILNRDGATIENIVFANLVITTEMRPAMWWGSGEPIAVSSLPRLPGGAPGLVRNLKFANIIGRAESGIVIQGSKDAPLEHISFAEVRLTIEKTSDISGGFHDMRPGTTLGPTGLVYRSIPGVFAADVAALSLHGIDLQWTGALPSYFGAALELHRCSRVRLDRVFGKAANGSPPSVMDEVGFDQPIAAGQ